MQKSSEEHSSEFLVAKREHKTTQTEIHNTILAEDRYLLKMASSDNRKAYNRLLTVAGYLRSNIQNKPGE